ncbi:MAG: nitroreductase family protein [Anaerolineae bacterium]|jgi:nitroreductase
MDTLSAIHRRFSVRSYAAEPVESALLERLLSFAERTDHLRDVPPRVALISGQAAVQNVLTFMVGSYGLVNNAPHLLAGILPAKSEEARIDLGYALEQVVLEATRLGLGTCWITGTYNAERAGDAVRLSPGETVAAVCALGQATEKGPGRLHTRLIRRLAGGHRRKRLSEIVFSEQWGRPWSAKGADPTLVTLLKHARLAPSAHNGQPWRFIVQPDGLSLAVIRPSFIDAGISMSHVALAAAAADREGQWDLRLRDEALAEACSMPDRAMPIGTFRFKDS